MNRKEFFKKLGLGIVGAMIAPKVFTEIKEELPTGKLEIPKNEEWCKHWAEEIYKQWVDQGYAGTTTLRT